MTRFTYIFVGLLAGGMTFLTASLYGGDLIAMVLTLQSNAHPAFGEMAGLLSSPILWALSNPAWGAALVGAFWPFAVFWIGASTLVGVVSASYTATVNLTFGLGIGTFF